jgi:S1-C subfamily serine protease
MKRICAAVLISCVGPHVHARDKKKDSEFSDLIAKVRSSVVQIQVVTTINSQVTVNVAGTGFLIGKNGFVATAEHVVRSIERASTAHPEAHVSMQVGFVVDGSFASVACKLVARDSAHDLAILSVTDPSKHISAVAFNTARLREGAGIFTSGYPLASTALITTSGTVASSEPIPVTDQSGAGIKDVYYADLRVNPGNSGGPVFDYDGNVVGVCLAYTSIGVKFMEDPQEEVTLMINGRARKLAYNAGIAHVILVSHLTDLMDTIHEPWNDGRYTVTRVPSKRVKVLPAKSSP